MSHVHVCACVPFSPSIMSTACVRCGGHRPMYGYMRGAGVQVQIEGAAPAVQALVAEVLEKIKERRERDLMGPCSVSDPRLTVAPQTSAHAPDFGDRLIGVILFALHNLVARPLLVLTFNSRAARALCAWFEEATEDIDE